MVDFMLISHMQYYIKKEKKRIENVDVKVTNYQNFNIFMGKETQNN